MKRALVSLCFAGGIVFPCTAYVHLCVCACVSGVCSVVALIEMTGCHDSGLHS